MKKRFHIIAILAMAICLVFGMMSISAYAYEYTMEVSGGNGQIDGNDSVKCESAQASTVDPEKNEIIIDGETVAVTPPSENHFVIGLKEAGHDNSEILTGEVKLSDEKQDTRLVVAYGLKTDMVEYTINYVRADNNQQLHPSETHYGVIGSRPVVSYKYTEGFLPQAYNLVGTIKAEGPNEFTFLYYEVDAEGNIITVYDTVPGEGGTAGSGAAAAGGGTAAGTAGGTAGGEGTAAGGEGTTIDNGTTPSTQPADIIDLDDDDTPTADTPDGEDGEEGDEGDEGEDIEDGATPKGVVTGGIIAAVVAAIGAGVFAVTRRKKDDDKEVK